MWSSLSMSVMLVLLVCLVASAWISLFVVFVGVAPASWHECKRSEEKLLSRKEKWNMKKALRKKKNRQKGKLQKRKADEVWLPVASDGECGFYDVEEEILLKRKHSDEHVKLVWGGQFAQPRGLGSFIDGWADEAVFKPHPGKFYIVRDADTRQILYRVKAAGLFAEDVDCHAEYKVIRKLPDCVKTNQAGKRYLADGNGFVGAIGIRYRYSEPRGSERQKLDSVASQNRALYLTVLQAVNRVANAIVRCAEQMGEDLRSEMEQLRGFVGKVCDMSGVASFTYPIASVGLNGTYGCHKDKRDTRTTLWGSVKSGGIAYPAYEHLCELSPGLLLHLICTLRPLTQNPNPKPYPRRRGCI